MKQLPAGKLDVVLYTRQQCHLCETAKEILLRHQLLPREIDVDTDPALAERFGQWVPVVEIDGKIRFRGHVNEKLLKRLL